MISPDGRYVAFLSQATDLSSVDASSDNLTDSSTAYLYVRDLTTGTTTLLDQTPGGLASDGGSTGTFVFSPDSKSLAFIDTSDDLTAAPVDPGSGSGGASPGWDPSTQPAVRVYPRPRGQDHVAGERLHGGGGLRPRTRSIPATHRASWSSARIAGRSSSPATRPT